VYSSKSYVFLTLFTAGILFSLNAIIRNYRIVFSDFSPSLLFSLITGIFTSFSTWALVSLIAVSLLAGVILTFSIFLLRRQIASGVSIGAPGILIAILSPACPSCALGIFSVLGLGGLFAFLPFKGMEVGMLGIIILLASIVYLSKKIVMNVCEI